MTESHEIAEDYADTMVRHLTELWEAADGGLDYDGEPAVDYLEDWPLEIVREVGKPFGVVFTVGGPYAAIESDADGNGATLVVSWGTATVRRYGYVVDRTAQYFAGMFE